MRVTYQLTLPDRTMTLDPERPVVIGRDSSCDVPLAADAISRRHARLTLAQDGSAVRVEDLGSANGVRVAGERATDVMATLPATVILGDQITLRIDARRSPIAARRLRPLLALTGLLIVVAVALRWPRHQVPVLQPQPPAAPKAMIAELPALEPAAMAAWADMQRRDAGFRPGALAWAIRGYRAAAATPVTNAANVAVSLRQAEADLESGFAALEFDARRALAVGDIPAARRAATRLALEARPLAHPAGERALMLLRGLPHSGDER